MLRELQQVNFSEVSKSGVFFFLYYEKWFHNMGGQSRLLSYTAVAEDFAYSFWRQYY